jgi:hypothetical protein
LLAAEAEVEDHLQLAAEAAEQVAIENQEDKLRVVSLFLH